jgi:hypothetical protein
MNDYDSPWKEALDSYFPLFMAFFFPQASAEIDWSRGYEALDKGLQQVAREAEVGRRVVDKLVKVWRKDGSEEWVLIHIEVQSQEESDFPLRMFIYNYRLFDRYNRSVCSLAVLGDDRANWRPDHFGYDLWGCRVDFQFPIVKLLDYAPHLAALESHPNPFAAVVLAHLKTQETRRDPDARRVWKVRLIKSLYDRGLEAEDVRRLFKFIDWMMDLPKGLKNLFWEEVAQYEKEKHMPFMTTPERIGLEKGLLIGIEAYLDGKFGAEGVKLLPEIHQIHDYEVLQIVLNAIKTASTPDEVRRVWTKPQQEP